MGARACAHARVVLSRFSRIGGGTHNEERADSPRRIRGKLHAAVVEEDPRVVVLAEELAEGELVVRAEVHRAEQVDDLVHRRAQHA